VDKLAIRIFCEFQDHKLHEEAHKLEEAALKKKKKEASDFLAPPPASFLESRPSLEEWQHSKEPLLISNGKHNILQNIILSDWGMVVISIFIIKVASHENSMPWYKILCQGTGLHGEFFVREKKMLVQPGRHWYCNVQHSLTK
jgi:hypothetical protein